MARRATRLQRTLFPRFARRWVSLQANVGNERFAGKHLFDTPETKKSKRLFEGHAMHRQLGARLNVKQKVVFRVFERLFTPARTIMETEMIELGPHPMTLQNKDGATQDVCVSLFLGEAEPFTFEDGDIVDEYNGYAMIKFDTFERRIETVAMNSLELAGRLMMLAEAYLIRTCEVENLTLYKSVPDDIKIVTDMFR